MSEEKKHKNLSDIPKKDIFKAPEGYFDTLQERIEMRIAGKEKRTNESYVIGIPADKFKYISLAIAASVALLIMFLPARQSDPASLSAAELIAQISDEDCLAFLQSSELEIDDLLGLSEPELWNEVMDEGVPDATNDLKEEDADLLYEQYGVSEDENLQML
jgi:hypothetical protein